MAYYNRGVFFYYSGKKKEACHDLKEAINLGYEPAKSVLMQITQK
jgi:lipoprotein NlpI